MSITRIPKDNRPKIRPDLWRSLHYYIADEKARLGNAKHTELITASWVVNSNLEEFLKKTKHWNESMKKQVKGKVIENDDTTAD